MYLETLSDKAQGKDAVTDTLAQYALQNYPKGVTVPLDGTIKSRWLEYFDKADQVSFYYQTPDIDKHLFVVTHGYSQKIVSDEGYIIPSEVNLVFEVV